MEITRAPESLNQGLFPPSCPPIPSFVDSHNLGPSSRTWPWEFRRFWTSGTLASSEDSRRGEFPDMEWQMGDRVFLWLFCDLVFVVRSLVTVEPVGHRYRSVSLCGSEIGFCLPKYHIFYVLQAVTAISGSHSVGTVLLFVCVLH